MSHFVVNRVANVHIDILFLLEEVTFFFVTETGSQMKYSILHTSIYINIVGCKTLQTRFLLNKNIYNAFLQINCMDLYKIKYKKLFSGQGLY